MTKLKTTVLDGVAAPNFDNLREGNPKYKSELISALNYATLVYTDEEFKKETIWYTQKALPEITHLMVAEPEEFYTLGKRCWLLNNGAWFDRTEITDLHEKIKKLSQIYVEKEKKVVPVQIKTKPKISDYTNILIEKFEGLIDDLVTGIKSAETFTTTNIHEILSIVPKFDKSRLTNHFQLQLTDIQLGGEGYDLLEEKHKNTVIALLKMIIYQISILQEETNENGETEVKKVRKPRKKKKVNPIKVVSKLKYKKDDSDFKIKSILPETILGASVLWIFNVKYRTVMQFIAADDNGLWIKGSTVLNFDEKKSVKKRLRKPEKFLKELETAGKITQRTLLDSVKAVKSIPKGRINKDCLLLKVYK